ncbi:MAG: glycosyltransferase family 4 protein [Planctomycetota bacterium]
MPVFPGESSDRLMRVVWSGDPHDAATRIEALDRALSAMRADIVIPNYLPEAFAASLLGRAHGRRTLGVCHSRDAWYLELFENAGPALDGAWAVSDECRRLIATTLSDDALTLSAPYGTRIPATAPALAPISGSTSPIRLLYLGRLDSMQKRVSRLVAVVASLETLGVPFTLTIAGDGPERPVLERAFRGNDHVRMLGAVDASKTPRLLEESHCLVLVSAYEGTPLAAVEALALGRPLLITDGCGGVCDAVREHECGIVVAQRDPEAMAQAIARLARDPRLLGTMAHNAYVCAKERFDFDTHATRLDSFVDTLLMRETVVERKHWESLVACAGLAAKRGRDDLPADALERYRYRLDPNGRLGDMRGVRARPRMGERLLRDAIDELSDLGASRIGIFPAGRHSERVGSVAEGDSRIVCFIDEAPCVEVLYDKPVRTPGDALERGLDAVVISSDQYEGILEDRARAWAGERPVRTLYVPIRIAMDERARS